MFGTAGRYLLTEALPSWHGVPVATLGANLAGAFVLGTLVAALARRGPDEGLRRATRLLLGTGFLGGFTTYSSLAVETDALLRGGQAALGLTYALGTVVLGALAAAAGILLAARRRAGEGGR